MRPGCHERWSVAAIIASRLAARWAWVTGTPRGVRVEPLVYCRTARSPGSGRTGGAAGARERTSQIIDEFATFAGRFRQSLEDLNVLDEVRSLRKEVESLAGRIAALEVTAKPAASTSRSTTPRCPPRCLPSPPRDAPSK